MKTSAETPDDRNVFSVAIIPSIFTFIRVGRLHITTISAMGVFTFGWLFLDYYPWLLTAVCALDWYIVNLINRVVDFREDRANRIGDIIFVRRYRSILLKASVVLLFASLVAVHFLNPAITGLRIAGHVLGFFYNWPLLPGKRRLKHLYFWKNTASGIGFLITVFGYPLATAIYPSGHYRFPPDITWATITVSAVFFFLFVQSYEIIYDLRDIKGDIFAGVRTYPAVHGEQKAGYLIDGLIFSSMAVLFLGYWFSVIPWRIFIMIGAPILQLVFYKTALRRGITQKDGIRITWLGAVLFFIYHLWNIAGLPGSGIK